MKNGGHNKMAYTLSRFASLVPKQPFYCAPHTLIVSLLLCIAPPSAHAISLHWPVACTLGQDCFIQNFVDHDLSLQARDFTCAPHSYDGHDGTDIRLVNLAAMRAGVAVKVVADGVVAGTRNNVEDTSIRAANAPDIAGRECGNGVRITHAEGYVTQSCHLMKGSIPVRTGQAVKAGDVIGNIGLSGNTEFPHLHLGVWKDGIKIDPFTGRANNSPCNPAFAAKPEGLWAKPIVYTPTAFLNDGFTTSTPDAAIVHDAPTELTSITADAPALIYWVDAMNLREGDRVTLSITAPDGAIFAQKTLTLEKAKASYFAFIGKKNSSGAPTVGEYTARAAITRGDEKPIVKSRVIGVQ